MRNNILIILIVLLLYPVASFCQIDDWAEDDTIPNNEYGSVIDDWLLDDTIPRKKPTYSDSLGRMKYRYMEEISYDHTGPKPVIEDTDTIFLCIYFYDLPEKVYDEISGQLETDGMIIPFTFYSSEEKYPGVGIYLTLNKFREMFKGIYDYDYEPTSSYNGFYWQEYVKSYTVPDSYKNRIKTVSVIDPQTGGCDAPF